MTAEGDPPHRDERRQKRGGGASSPAILPSRDEDSVLEQVLSREPTPELAAQVGEEYRRLLARLGDPELEAVALLRLEGYSVDEIAEQLGYVARSIKRKLQLIRSLWEKELRRERPVRRSGGAAGAGSRINEACNRFETLGLGGRRRWRTSWSAGREPSARHCCANWCCSTPTTAETAASSDCRLATMPASRTRPACHGYPADGGAPTRTHTVSPVEPVPDALRGVRSFGDYTVLAEIARGGMGVVYQARRRAWTALSP